MYVHIGGNTEVYPVLRGLELPAVCSAAFEEEQTVAVVLVFRVKSAAGAIRRALRSAFGFWLLAVVLFVALLKGR